MTPARATSPIQAAARAPAGLCVRLKAGGLRKGGRERAEERERERETGGGEPGPSVMSNC